MVAVKSKTLRSNSRSSNAVGGNRNEQNQSKMEKFRR